MEERRTLGHDMRQHSWPEYESPGLTELRIHGAGATPISEMLDSPVYVRVAGDDTAGFYRVPASDQITDPDKDDPRAAAHNLTGPDGEPGQVEAYHWGKFSSGGGWRAFWILLLPFALVNVAGWFAPRRSGFARSLVRLFGLLTSVALVYWIASITVGILAECGPGSLCAERKFYLRVADLGFFVDRPSRLAIIGLVLGWIVCAALWLGPGRRSADANERFTPKTDPREEQELGSGSLLSLDGERLWHSEQASRWLGAAHVLAMLAALSAGAFVAVGSVQDLGTIGASSPYFLSVPEQWFPRLFVVICFVVFLASAVFVMWLDPLPGKNRGPRVPTSRDCAVCRNPGTAALIVGTALTAIAASWIWFARLGGDLGEGAQFYRLIALKNVYFRFANSGFVVLVVLIVAVLALLALAPVFRWILARISARPDPAAERSSGVLGGFGPFLASSTALVVLAAGVTGGILWVADLFGEPDYRVPSVENIEIFETRAEEAMARLPLLDLEDGVNSEEFATLQGAIDAIGRLRDLQAQLGEPLIRLGPEYYHMPLAFTAMTILLLAIYLVISAAALARIPAHRMLSKNRIDKPIVDAVDERRPEDDAGREKLNKEMASLLRKPFRNRRLHIAVLVPGLMTISLLLILFDYDLVARNAERANALLEVSVWLTVGIFVALAFVVRDHYRGGATRNALGGIWDIITFWPRFYHPFAPPSYAVRAVPEIAGRIGQLTRTDLASPRVATKVDELAKALSMNYKELAALIASRTGGPSVLASQVAEALGDLASELAPGNAQIAHNMLELAPALQPKRLVLSAHSQGVPTTIAALSLVSDPESLKRTALLTYGSPTGMLYARFFPDYFDSEELTAVAQSIRTSEGNVRWSNLWRLGDWTGGYAVGPRKDEQYLKFLPFFLCKVSEPEDGTPLYSNGNEPLAPVIGEHRLSDPDRCEILSIDAGDPLPVPMGHSDYLHDRLYPDYRETLVAALYESDALSEAVLRSDVADEQQVSVKYFDDSDQRGTPDKPDSTADAPEPDDES